jgi:hypothetical protein
MSMGYTFLLTLPASRQLEEIDSTDTSAGWFARIWKPARFRVLGHLRSISIEDVAFIFAALEVAEIRERLMGAPKSLEAGEVAFD